MPAPAWGSGSPAPRRQPHPPGLPPSPALRGSPPRPRRARSGPACWWPSLDRPWIEAMPGRLPRAPLLRRALALRVMPAGARAQAGAPRPAGCRPRARRPWRPRSPSAPSRRSAGRCSLRRAAASPRPESPARREPAGAPGPPPARPGPRGRLPAAVVRAQRGRLPLRPLAPPAQAPRGREPGRRSRERGALPAPARQAAVLPGVPAAPRARARGWGPGGRRGPSACSARSPRRRRPSARRRRRPSGTS